jgi:hypothetical protein
VSRSYSEFLKLAEALSVTCPQSIIPALPLAQTSAATDDEDDRLVKLAFQRWVARITSDPAIARDDELRSFIESDFGVSPLVYAQRPDRGALTAFILPPQYTPRSTSRRKTTSTFHFPRGARLPGEQDDDLTLAKSAMNRLENQLLDTAKVVEKVSRARRSVAVAYSDVGDHLNTFATTETYTPLASGIKKLARTTKIHADLLAVQVSFVFVAFASSETDPVSRSQATSEQVSLGDALAYQAMNARSAKVSPSPASDKPYIGQLTPCASRKPSPAGIRSSTSIAPP